MKYLTGSMRGLCPELAQSRIAVLRVGNRASLCDV